MSQNQRYGIVGLFGITAAALALTGCAEDPEQATADFSLKTSPEQQEIVMGEEADHPYEFVSQVVYDESADKHVSLTIHTSNAAVATVDKLIIQPDSGSFTDWPSAADVITAHPFGVARCQPGTFCYWADPIDEGKLQVKCHGVGTATITISGTLFVRDMEQANKTDATEAGFASATHTVKATTAFDVTCVAKVGQTPGCDTEGAEPVNYLGEQLVGDGNALCSLLVDPISDEPTVHSSDEVAPQPGTQDHTETRARLATRVTITAEQLAAGAAEVLGCGSHDRGATLCANPAELPLAGDYVLVTNLLYGDVPAEDVQQLTYGFVFDADGDPLNNYAADPAYPNDWYQDTDQWYEAGFAPGAGWTATARQIVDGGPQSLSSSARLVIIDNSVSLLVPAHELATAAPSYRITAFRHPGDWGFGGDWSGDVEPPVLDGLAPFSPNR